MSNRKDAGFTLIQLMASLVIIGVVLAIIGAAFSSSSLWITVSGGNDRAKAQLDSYTQQAGLIPISCVGQDSDNNGYVSCSAKDKSGNLISIECAYGFFASGCKSIPIQFPIQSNPQQ